MRVLDVRRPRRLDRRRGFLWSAPVVILVVLVAVKLVATGLFQAHGMAAYAARDADAARTAFSRAGILNVIQPWVAHRNIGATAYQAGDLGVARTELRRALDAAPRSHVCRIRFDLALVHESRADTVAQRNPRQAAAGYRAALATLRADTCPVDASEVGRGTRASIHRLQQKLSADPRNDPTWRKPPRQPRKSADRSEASRLDQLRQRNAGGVREREEQQDYDRGGLGPGVDRFW